MSDTTVAPLLNMDSFRLYLREAAKSFPWHVFSTYLALGKEALRLMERDNDEQYVYQDNVIAMMVGQNITHTAGLPGAWRFCRSDWNVVRPYHSTLRPHIVSSLPDWQIRLLIARAEGIDIALDAAIIPHHLRGR